MIDRLIDYVMSYVINWNIVTAVAAVIAALATVAYAAFVLITLFYVRRQVRVMEDNRKLQIALVVFRELGAPEVRRSRRYIYTQVPRDVTGINDTELQRHLENAEEALIAFDRVGYLFERGQLTSELIMDNIWAMTWLCWRGTYNLRQWTADRRGDPTYLSKFDILFEASEEYRLSNNLTEPKFYYYETSVTC